MAIMGTWRCLWALFALNMLFALSSAAQKPLQTVIDAAPKRVAVIGAGAGGSFAASELRKLADASDIPVNVTVFERASYIGGRSTTIDAFDDPAYPIELGASIFVKVNQILMNASDDLGLFVLGADHARPRQTDDSIGIWDGSKFVFTVQNSSSWWNIAKLFWRYGLAPLRTQNLMKEIVGRFLKLYEEPLFPFRSLSEAAAAVNLVNVTASPGDAFLNANSISELFAREIIQASTRVNYGQNLGLIHGLESMVCMATDGAVSVHGGNWRIFDGVLKAAKTEVRLNTTVTKLVRSKEGTVRITSKPTGLDSTQSDESEFDEVVIAGPLQYSDISISPPLERVPDDIPYAKLHVTLLASPHRISSQFFGLDDKSSPPETILTILPEGLDLGANPKGVGPAGFWSVSTLREVPRIIVEDGKEQTEDHYVYKIFSPERPTAEFIAELFGIEYSKSSTSDAAGPGNTTIGDLPKSEVSWYHEKVWYPYPLMYPRVTFEEVLLAPSVWYTSGIESFISTMETSALMGRNVAALMVQSWQREKDERDGLDFSTGRTEL
ncbi:Prenylcysteine oxidase [Penicillium longicatenatum]|uniref:Prenylcysteine oxidase n=1 Tax=Penicillium longicatenatum TaxID=1561947 RepID=UPI00254760B2|nr:Prenylcysteine oxidase [Penicillium longicatenatum]KAJ5661308.1 Prenylcysteine oxidase [Penicillium longicatenatum]